MKHHITLALILSIGLSSHLNADDRRQDVAKFFPAQSVAYIEITHPGDLLAGVQRFFGSRAAEAILNDVHNRQDRAKNANELKQARLASQFELLFSPDVANILKQVGPVGVAVLEMTPEQQTRYACVVPLNDCSAVRLMLQNYLVTGGVRRVGEVDGLPIFQRRDFVAKSPNNSEGAVKEQKGKPPSTKKEPSFSVDASEMELTFAR